VKNQVVKAKKSNIDKSKVDMEIGNNTKSTRYYNGMNNINKFQ